jgi:hypothetical protein
MTRYKKMITVKFDSVMIKVQRRIEKRIAQKNLYKRIEWS